MEAKDFVGWTVNVPERSSCVDPGLYYCVSVNRFGSLQLRKHGEQNNANLESELFINLWLDTWEVMPFRQGDFAP